ncbi:zinc finger protein ZFPM1 isoform X3 [Oncorhynchus nerka]|uniref:zinc finger protein ZFPM1 isoform X3 n=1 Tax=Oncorhynchus nerka TaxID=8023 RepID=UPI00113063A9|nr:zinc finger protein ZFPM1-like isoform X1 [Oncorhynchus nerka]
MSRRKQSKPRQIKRSTGDLEGDEDNTPDDVSLSGDEGGASDPEDSAECDSSSPPPYTPLYIEEPRTHDCLGAPDDEDEEQKGPTHTEEEGEEMEEEEDGLHWRGPDDLELSDGTAGPKVLACRDLTTDTLWGPYTGIVQSEEAGDDQVPEQISRLTLVCEDDNGWLSRVPLTSDATAANCTIYSQGEELYCKVTQDISTGDSLLATLSLSSVKQLSSSQTQDVVVKEEPTGVYPASLHSEIQLLPQQAGMAAILATAVVNKDIFPCKDCGIWYRSERNLQAHLMYYCASRQKQQASSSPPLDKAKESYPNERVCPFPQCNKSCPSASSLEIHMRTHSGERPFVCLICLSAFTTKANCERHLKVHTDTQNGVCHGCGFVSTTRDILYSHLVTSHMVCQPGSCSEVYSPGPGLPKLPLSTGLSPGDSGVVLKCQVCGHITDSPAQLQQHVRTHLEVRVPAERSPTPRQTTPSSADHPEHLDREPPACVPHPDSSSPGANGSSATPRGCSPPDQLPTDIRIKEEPHSDSENDGQEEETEGERVEKSRGHRGTGSSQTSTSPRSPSAVAVKAEPTSPTPGSSPAHLGGAGSVLPGEDVFLPQYMFSQEPAILPQASEILAKMSEMVHSRLKQGQVPPGAAPAFYPAGTTTTVQKGATCFECDINFNNINNFYVHKRLYCSSRHQQGDMAGPVKEGASGATVPSVGHGSSPQAGSGSRAASASPSDSGPVPGSTATQGKLVEVKSENPGVKEAVSSSSSEGEGGGGGGRASECSQSPSGSAEDQEDDPTRTFCQACNIHFSRHENYTVHKRFYCASRHDPSNQRSTAGKATFLPQPIRTRKRKKMYEIHMARTEALANTAAASLSAPGLSLAVKQEAAASVERVLESPVPALALGLRPATSRSTSPDRDGPIDLSKRPRLREAPRGSSIPSLPLTDYHKCTACSISFNSIENYLAHKAYYCPATTLQPHTLETLHRLKRPASISPKSRALERSDVHSEAKGLLTEKAPRGASLSPHLSALPGSGSEATSPYSVPAAKGPGSPSVVCPYCPPNRAVTCDLVEHFRSMHGLVLSLEGQPAVISPSLSPRDGTPATPPKLVLRACRDSINGRIRRDTVSPSSPLVNGSPLGHHAGGGSSPNAAPPAVSPTRSLPLTVSPVPEVLREVGVLNHQVAVTLLPDKASLTLGLPLPVPAPPTPKTLLIPPVQNGNTRFCRLCNIKFSSLSTFIAHKKYYCSSHSAEHVK